MQRIVIQIHRLMLAGTITVFFFFYCFSTTLAQANSRDDKRITYTARNIPLWQVFKIIKQQTNLTVFTSADIMDFNEKVNIDFNNTPIKEALHMLFRGRDLEWEIKDASIILHLVKKNLRRMDTGGIKDSSVHITGKVTDGAGNPIPGATILIKGTRDGATTNSEGRFSLPNVKFNAELIVSSIGYEKKTVQIKGQNITVELKAVVNDLDETVVIAYGTTTKRFNTGNVSKVSASEIEKQPVNNPLLTLQGRIPGLEITQSSGLPGAGIRIQIRGRNSLTNGFDPLFIIDGVPYISQKFIDISAAVLGYGNATPGNPFSHLNPADIESIEVLKDADATAIYGSRGANGVVLITTKKGKAGESKIDINMQSGWGKVGRKLELLNTRQYLEMRHEAFKNDGAVPNPNADFDVTLWDSTRETDWQKELIGETARYTDIQTSFSGGNAQTQYLIGAGYHKETTVFPGNYNDLKVSTHFNINNRSQNKKFRISLSGLYTVDNNQLGSHDLTEEAITLPPNAPALYNSDGSLNWAHYNTANSTWPYNNPAAQLLQRFKTKTNTLVSNASIGYIILPGLEIKSNGGYTNTQTNEVVTIPFSSYDPVVWPSRQREARFGISNTNSWIIEPQITYLKKIAKGDFTLLAGATIQQNNIDAQRLDAAGFNTDLVMEDLKAATSIIVHTTVNSVYKYNAVFGRLNYNWQEKYIINLTARRDGSSRFGPANRFHNFGAIGLGWLFSSEKFIQTHFPFISYGKLRASYGSTGSDQVGDYSFMDLYTPDNAGIPYLGVNGIYPSKIFTPDLAWEETRKFEAGLELGFIDDRIVLTGSFYRNRSSNQLVDYSLPSITGFISVKRNLDALVQNKGWEFEVRTTNVNTNNFHWYTSANLTLNRNLLVSGPEGLDAFYRQKIGYPLSSIFVYHSLGVDPITGLYQVADAHGSPTSNPSRATDATSLIDFTPTFYGGLQNSINYKGLELDFLFQFRKQLQAPIYLHNYIPGAINQVPGSNQPVTVLDRWQQPGDVRPIQRFSQNSSTLKNWVNARDSDQQYGDASYIRLKNLSLSWQLPDRLKQNLHAKNVKIYVQGQNLLTITNYKGLDPETVSSITLPPLRVITFGIQAIL